MSNRLRSREKCPLHNSYFCCGRSRPKSLSKPPQVHRFAVAVLRVPDEHHPRGYRELCNRVELRKRKHELMATGPLTCLYCKKPLTDYREIDLCHIEPKGMGGARRDDHRDNLALGHRACNLANGSRRIA